MKKSITFILPALGVGRLKVVKCNDKDTYGCTMLQFPELHSHLSAPKAWPKWLTKGQVYVTIRPREKPTGQHPCECSMCQEAK